MKPIDQIDLILSAVLVAVVIVGLIITLSVL